MLVSHRKKFIYTKTVKTAGTSVECYFEPYCMPEGEWRFSHHRDEYTGKSGIIGCRGPHIEGKTWFNHMTAENIRERLGHEVWKDYLKFCVVRNPFDMLVSWFYFQFARGLIDREEERHPGDLFRERMSHGIPLLGRGQYVIDGSYCMDTVIRFERLESDTQRVCDRLDIPFEPQRLPKLKSGFRDNSIPLQAFYSAELIEKVNETYKFELDKFGYSFEACQ